MNVEDFNRYYLPAVLRYVGMRKHQWKDLDEDVQLQYCAEFDHRIGRGGMIATYAYRPSLHDFPIDDELRNLLTLLQGPHASVILKAYRIKNGLDTEHV